MNTKKGTVGVLGGQREWTWTRRQDLWWGRGWQGRNREEGGKKEMLTEEHKFTSVEKFKFALLPCGGSQKILSKYVWN